jgi:hypothetical protein
MSSSYLLSKIKEASPDGENFILVISTINEHEDQEVIKIARKRNVHCFKKMRSTKGR